MEVALGERTFQELRLVRHSPFVRREVAMKGYEGPNTAWAISFEGLQEFLKTAR